MNEFIELVWQPTLLVGALTYLAKKTIEHLFKAKEKGYEGSIKSIADQELAIFKAGIDRTSQMFNVKTSGVYEKQALVFTEIYGQLSDLEHSMNIAIDQGSPGDENYVRFKKEYFELRNYWRRNRILLPSKIDMLIHALVKDAFWSVEKYGSGEKRFLAGDFDGGEVQKQEATTLKQSIPQIMEQLTTNFRSHIGVVE